MDVTAFIHSLLSTQTPALPSLEHLRIARYLSWAIVLAFMVMYLGQRWPRWLQRGLAGLLFVWTLIPGPVSPAFWLGLAFQIPSLVSTVICLAGLVIILRTGTWRLCDPAQIRALQWTGLIGVVLGWLLLLDTFAVLPLSLYGMGFSPALLGVVAVLVSLPWVIFGPRHPSAVVTLLLATVLLLHVLLRLPTGNLWDALIDPWLWLVLQIAWLVYGGRRLSAALRARRATRA
jgi:hypothetical protein